MRFFCCLRHHHARSPKPELEIKIPIKAPLTVELPLLLISLSPLGPAFAERCNDGPYQFVKNLYTASSFQTGSRTLVPEIQSLHRCFVGHSVLGGWEFPFPNSSSSFASRLFTCHSNPKQINVAEFLTNTESIKTVQNNEVMLLIQNLLNNYKRFGN